MDRRRVVARLDALAREAAGPAERLATRATGQGPDQLVVGQATGLLAERYALSMDRAHALLERLARDLRREVAMIAAEVVETRQLPDRTAS